MPERKHRAQTLRTVQARGSARASQGRAKHKHTAGTHRVPQLLKRLADAPRPHARVHVVKVGARAREHLDAALGSNRLGQQRLARACAHARTHAGHTDACTACHPALSGSRQAARPHGGKLCCRVSGARRASRTAVRCKAKCTGRAGEQHAADARHAALPQQPGVLEVVNDLGDLALDLRRRRRQVTSTRRSQSSPSHTAATLPLPHLSPQADRMRCLQPCAVLILPPECAGWRWPGASEKAQGAQGRLTSSMPWISSQGMKSGPVVSMRTSRAGERKLSLLATCISSRRYRRNSCRLLSRTR